ncbi:MAG TPA: hypothetical protein VHX37_05080 [Acidobacteriaceae bacterium]|jgi:hypothetical protein|nr:hypothetical protein [Acidobacteriaceae bacterium]
MKGLIGFLLLLACALCAIAQTKPPVSAPHSLPGAGMRAAAPASSPDPQPGNADLGLFAAGSGALASLLFVWSPFGAAWRRRLGSRAELSALILTLLLCGIMAVEGCGASSTASSAPVSVQSAS